MAIHLNFIWESRGEVRGVLWRECEGGKGRGIPHIVWECLVGRRKEGL